LKKLGK